MIFWLKKVVKDEKQHYFQKMNEERMTHTRTLAFVSKSLELHFPSSELPGFETAKYAICALPPLNFDQSCGALVSKYLLSPKFDQSYGALVSAPKKSRGALIRICTARGVSSTIRPKVREKLVPSRKLPEFRTSRDTDKLLLTTIPKHARNPSNLAHFGYFGFHRVGDPLGP